MPDFLVRADLNYTQTQTFKIEASTAAAAEQKFQQLVEAHRYNETGGSAERYENQLEVEPVEVEPMLFGGADVVDTTLVPTPADAAYVPPTWEFGIQLVAKKSLPYPELQMQALLDEKVRELLTANGYEVLGLNLTGYKKADMPQPET